MRADAWATRVGVFPYLMGDGSIRRELRHPDEVFNPDSIRSLGMIPVTDDHPPVELTAENTKMYMVGYTSEQVKRDGDYLGLSLTVTEKPVIQKVVSKQKSELSCGYMCDVFLESGVYKGEAYDAVQRNIRYNHLAIVKEGRAGPLARIKMDSKAAVLVEGDNLKSEQEKKSSTQNSEDQLNLGSQSTQDESKKGVLTMAKIKIDGVEYEVADGVAVAITAKLQKIDELEGTLKAEKSEKEKLQGKCDALEAESKKAKEDLEQAKKDSALTSQQIVAMGKARIELEEMGKNVLGAEGKVDSMADLEIKKAIVSKLLPSLSFEGKSDAQIEGAFEAVRESAKNSKSDSFKQALGEAAGRGDAGDELKIAREKRRKDAAEAWKKNLPQYQVAK